MCHVDATLNVNVMHINMILIGHKYETDVHVRCKEGKAKHRYASKARERLQHCALILYGSTL